MNKKILVGLATLTLVSNAAVAQSLVEVAKAERERRATLPSASRVYSNADLRVYPPPVVSPVEPSFDLSFPTPRLAEGPSVSVYGYDKWWPFDGPPERLQPQRWISISTYTGHGHYSGVGQRNRVGSKEPRFQGGRSWK